MQRESFLKRKAGYCLWGYNKYKEEEKENEIVEGEKESDKKRGDLKERVENVKCTQIIAP